MYSQVIQHRATAWEKKQTYNADGVRSGYEPFEVGTGRTGLLMVHGFGDGPAVWRPMAEELASRGFRCRALRLPGFGDRLAVRKDVDTDAWLDTVSREAKILRASCDEVWIVAHSLGASISLQSTFRGEVSPDGMVLLAPLFEVGSERSPVLTPRAWFRLLGRHIPVAESLFEPDVFKPLPEDYPPAERFITSNVYKALFGVIDANRDHAEDLRVPLLMAVSPHDHVADEDVAAAWFARTVNTPASLLIRCENSGHVLSLDADASTLTDAIERFVRKNGK
jgi:carboxylesterase